MQGLIVLKSVCKKLIKTLFGLPCDQLYCCDMLPM